MGLFSFWKRESEAERYPDVEHSKRRVADICNRLGISEQELYERAARGGLNPDDYRDRNNGRGRSRR